MKNTNTLKAQQAELFKRTQEYQMALMDATHKAEAAKDFDENLRHIKSTFIKAVTLETGELLANI